MKIERIDHLVLTVENIDRTIEFYSNILGMDVIFYGAGRRALSFGNQKINLHKKNNEIEPKAEFPTCGSVDVCLITSANIKEVEAELKNKEVEIIEGIVERAGAMGIIHSIYIRDPDKNLIEISEY